MKKSLILTLDLVSSTPLPPPHTSSQHGTFDPHTSTKRWNLSFRSVLLLLVLFAEATTNNIRKQR